MLRVNIFPSAKLPEQVREAKGSRSSVQGAGLPRDKIRPILSHICLYWAVNSLKVGPHLFSYFEHHYSSETEF